MNRPRQVAVLANVSRRFDRRVIQGVTAYMWERGGWSLYVEEDPLQKLPKLQQWDGDGIIADLDDRKIAVAVRGLAIPVIGFGGGRGWYLTRVFRQHLGLSPGEYRRQRNGNPNRTKCSD